MTEVVRLPKVLDIFELQERLVYRGTIAWTFGGHPRVRDWKRRTSPRWKPVLIYHKGSIPRDAEWVSMEVKSQVSNIGDLHKWEQDVSGFETLIRNFSAPGDTVCDPFLGSGTTGSPRSLTTAASPAATLIPRRSR
jgi:hypothetical protein